MFLILVTGLFYVAISIANSFLLSYLSAPLLLLILYALPLVINFIIYKFQKRERKLLTALVNPTFSVVSYLLFAYITSSSGAWLEFAQKNTVSNSDMSLEIATNLLSVSQILFVVVLFYSLSIMHYYIWYKMVNKGVSYA